jgi:hypothetical protein
MTLKQIMKFEGMPQKVVERDLTELLRKYDRKCAVLTANRLNRLRGGSVATPDETRALMEWSDGLIASFRDGET